MFERTTPRLVLVDGIAVEAPLSPEARAAEAAGIPLDATLRDYQRTTYGGRSNPLHGGEGTLGLFNHMNTRWNGNGYTAGGGGPSFVMVTSFGNGCPDDRTLLLGSQRSQHSGWHRAADQVSLYADKQWVNPPFCDDELAAADAESVTVLGPDGVESVTGGG